MKRTVRTLAWSLALCGVAQGVGALGFGRLPSQATLGEPLNLAIAVRLEPGEEIPPDCVHGEVYFADERQQPGTLSIRLDSALPGAAERTLRVITTRRVDEPLVTVEISAGCGAKLSRRFTLFADPPLLVAAEEPATSSAAAAVAPPGSQPIPPAPASDPAAPSAASAAPVARAPAAAPRPRAAAPRRVAAAPAASGTTPMPRARPAQARNRPQQPSARLQIVPLEAGALAAAKPALGATAAASEAAQAAQAAASAAAAEQAASAAEAAARARVEQLEASMNKLRADTGAAQQTIASLQTRLANAEQGRFSNPLVWALLAAVALLLAALALLWRQRNQEREAHAWLAHAAANPPEGTPAGDAATAEAVAFAPESMPSEPVARSAPAPLGYELTRPASASLGPASAPSPLNAVPQQKREVSVEELIDLEQQAEFFVVLGQDEAAIDLLMGHLRSSSGNSPLPYLKLLEIYKRRGERKEYERLRERFNSRFSAVAPAWETDLQEGRSLEEYPAVIERLQNLWFSPQRAMDVLQTTLLRSQNADADPTTAEGFDLPAYRELMLLYSVARDRSEDASGPTVDVLLPLGEGEEGVVTGGVFERLLATTPLEAQPAVHKPLKVDLPLYDEPAPTEPPLHFEPTELEPGKSARDDDEPPRRY